MSKILIVDEIAVVQKRLEQLPARLHGAEIAAGTGRVGCGGKSRKLEHRECQ
jgi:hypothetical protein